MIGFRLRTIENIQAEVVMGLGKKISTLLSARLRSSFSRKSKRRQPAQRDPESQLEAVRQALDEMEAREQEVAGQLKVAQSRAEEAAEKGDREEKRAQERLVAQLETHLETQSTQAIALSEQLTRLEENLTQEPPADRQPPAQTTTRARTEGGKTEEISHIRRSRPADDTSSPSDDDLEARKSRLSD